MTCPVCSHPAGNAIDNELLELSTPGDVGVRYGIDGGEILGHVTSHWQRIPAGLMLETWSMLSSFDAEDYRVLLQSTLKARGQVRRPMYRSQDRPVPPAASNRDVRQDGRSSQAEIDALLERYPGGRATLAFRREQQARAGGPPRQISAETRANLSKTHNGRQRLADIDAGRA